MITDLILLAFTFLLIGSIFFFVSSSLPQSSVDPSQHPLDGSSSSNSTSARSNNKTELGKSASIDWDKHEFKLRTNMRPKTQQEILESADQAGRDSGKYVTEHASSFSFRKDATSSNIASEQ